MPQVARIADVAVGICHCHNTPIGVSGLIITGSPRFSSDGRPVARLADIVLAGCGHVGFIVTASGKLFSDGRGVARVTDLTTGCFVSTIVTGSPTFSSV